MCDRYHVNVYFAEDFVVGNIFAIEAPMGGVPYQCPIGRDILRLATLVYDGRNLVQKLNNGFACRYR